MTCYSERTEGTQVAAIFQGNEAERDDDEQDRLLVYVPAEKERCVATQGKSCDEIGPGRTKEKFD